MPKTILRRSLNLDLAGAHVPAIGLFPQLERHVPGVLLLHGYSSSKERLAASMGQSLAVRGIASIAIDLPLHGSRDDAIIDEARSNPLGLVRHWNMALAEARDAIAWLARHDEIDSDKLCIAGYSLGSFIGLQTAANDRRVGAMIIAAGGDLPATPWTGMVRMVTDPLKSVRAMDGRPLLMLHGKSDRTIPPQQAQRLYDAALTPKELRWYDSGHILPAQAADDAARWLNDKFGVKTDAD
ncbi:MAG TPA: alpha/beta fold hydrolase [Gemmatimonadaceae bacterium]